MTVVSSTRSDTPQDLELFPEHASTRSATVEGNKGDTLPVMFHCMT